MDASWLVRSLASSQDRRKTLGPGSPKFPDIRMTAPVGARNIRALIVGIEHGLHACGMRDRYRIPPFG